MTKMAGCTQTETLSPWVWKEKQRQKNTAEQTDVGEWVVHAELSNHDYYLLIGESSSFVL